MNYSIREKLCFEMIQWNYSLHHISSKFFLFCWNKNWDDIIIKINKGIHEGAKDLQWYKCSKMLGQKYDLLRNIKTINNRINLCHKCSRSFGQKGDLLRHMITIIKGTNHFSCDICPKFFDKKIYLQRHTKTNYDGNQYVSFN